MYQRLIDYIRGLYAEYGYEEVITPQIFDRKLFETSGHLQSGQLDLVCSNLLNNGGRQRKRSQASMQARAKGAHHHNPKQRNRKNARYARHCIVDARSCTDSVLTY